MNVRPRAGMVYRWVGLPGQYDTERLIRLDALDARCHVQAAIIDAGTPDRGIGEVVELCSIGLSDLVAAITLGYLVHLPHLDQTERPQQ